MTDLPIALLIVFIVAGVFCASICLMILCTKPWMPIVLHERDFKED